MTDEQGLEDTIEMLAQCCEPFCRRYEIEGEWVRVSEEDELYPYVKSFLPDDITHTYCPSCLEDLKKEVKLIKEAKIRPMEIGDAAILDKLDKEIYGEMSCYGKKRFEGLLNLGAIGYVAKKDNNIVGYIIGIDPKLVDYKPEDSESKYFPPLQEWGLSPEALELLRQPGAYELSNISVVAEEHGRGYGSWLLRDFMRTLCRLGYTDLCAQEIFDGNFEHLARKFGFEKKGVVYMPEELPEDYKGHYKAGGAYGNNWVLKIG